MRLLSLSWISLEIQLPEERPDIHSTQPQSPLSIPQRTIWGPHLSPPFLLWVCAFCGIPAGGISFNWCVRRACLSHMTCDGHGFHPFMSMVTDFIWMAALGQSSEVGTLEIFTMIAKSP